MTTATATTATKWSEYQTAIFDRVLSAVAKKQLFLGNTMALAGPGSGKTTTTVELVKMMVAAGVKDILVTAYGRGIVAELSARLKGVAGVKVQSIYGVGFAVIGRHLRTAYNLPEVTVDDRKYSPIVKEYVLSAYQGWLETGATDSKEGELMAYLGKLVDYARLTLTDASSVKALEAMALEYNLDYEGCLLPAVKPILEAGIEEARKGRIDFTDQIWLPNVLAGEIKKIWKYGAVILDEAQDVAKASRGVAKMVLWERGLFVGVGDENQSIMGFAGADMRSFKATTATFKAKVLPLPVCYRSDMAIIRELQKMVPEIQGRDNAPEGVVTTIEEKLLLGELKARVGKDVVVLCRTTADLVHTCIQLIRDGVPAQVKGRDIGAQIIGYLDKIALLDGFNYPTNFAEYARAFQAMQCRKHQTPDGMGGYETKEGHEAQVQKIEDYVSTLIICHEAWTATTLDALRAKIESLFADTVKGIILMTGHRSKGLEFDEVYILRSDRMRMNFPGMNQDQRHQEFCVEFVMKSRAKHRLVYVKPEKA